MGSAAEVRSALEDFIDDLNSKVDTHRLEELLNGDATLDGGRDIGSKPEAWTRKHLIRKLLQAVDLEWEPEIHGGGEGYPDFGITNLDVLVIGEDKSINKIEEAKEDVKQYLNNRAASQGTEYGIATDGIEWVLYRIELGGDYLDYDMIEPTPVDFRRVLLQIARNKNYISQQGATELDVDEWANQFYEIFTADNLNTLLTQDAPKRIRAKKKAGIEEFYDLYVELLFGEGKADYEYDTTLLDDIRAPDGVTETEKRKFAIKLVNRLLFVKFLEDRGVLPSDFLSDRIENYNEASEEIDQFGGGLYKSQLEPIFFSLFNTPSEDRISKHRNGWFDQVPYLNGSLFAPEQIERNYDVDDRMLKKVVVDLVEGHKLGDQSDLNSGLDPSVLGNVFEMTINHISGGDSQQEEGAYYTPSDVIKLITEQSVDPKIYDVLIDVYGQRISEATSMSEEDARSFVSDKDLDEMLAEIEKRNGYFSDPDTIQEAYDQLGELKVVDPACGSGHFLTSVLDEIHRVRMSLLRGLEGDELDDKDVYQAKKELVLNAVYGVDVNPIAIEIAKLRVWLKMVEEGWEQEYGRLPNIDVNIVDGNSLVGLPAKSSGQSLLGTFDVDLSTIQDVREQYKSGDINRQELNSRISDLRPELRQIYADNLNHYFESTIEDASEYDDLVDGLDSLYPVVKTVRARRQDGNNLSDEDQELLEEMGFRTYKKSARIADEDLTGHQNDFRSLLDSKFKLELERRPTTHDIQRLEELGEMSHEPFHWVVEFPEAVVSDGSGYSVDFDIVVGNPPYGDLLSDLERRFTSGYNTGSMNDIAAQFLERELQLLGDEGYFGNVITLRLIYDSKAYRSRKEMKKKLTDTKVACFGWRPSYIFAGSEALAAIICGQKAPEDEDDNPIESSRFILFSQEDRKTRLENIRYYNCDDLALGDKIGTSSIGESDDKSMPKVGSEVSRSVIEKLRDASNSTIRDREIEDETEHVVWRKEGARYWINPLLESFWSEEERSRETKPMYFDSELDRHTVFLLLQSSLYYHHWMTYGDQQHVSWKLVRSFPVPDNEDLQKHSEEIAELANDLWEGMEKRFHRNIGVKGEIQNIAELKPTIDEIDELFGSLFGLTEEEIEHVKQLDTEYGRSLREPDQEELPTLEAE